MGTREDAQKALAQFLGCNPDELDEAYGYSRSYGFSYGDEEYAVYDDYEDAEEDAKQDVIELMDECGGIALFNEGFRQQIIYNGWVNTEWFDDAKHESNESYAYDIKDESASSDEYANRLIEEAVERDLITDDDIDENGNYIGDEDDLYERFIEDMDNDYDDSVEWFRDNFGDEEFGRCITENNLADEDRIAEECVAQDGVANSLARYDGKENDIDYEGTTYYIYRMN